MPISVARQGMNLPNGNFLPEVWSQKLAAKYWPRTIVNDITNHNWEGEISGKGSKVQIRLIPSITVTDDAVNSTISYQNLSDDKIELPIDRAKTFAFYVSDIDKAQSDINILNTCTAAAAKDMAVEINKTVLGSIYTGAGASLPSTQVTSTSVLNWIIDAAVALDDAGVDDDGRWLALPPWIIGMIKKSDLKNAYITGDDKSILRSPNGMVGMIDRFKVYYSPNIFNNGTTWSCMAGHKEAVTFASQIARTETIRLQDRFGDAIRSQNVFGFKVITPSGLIYMPATK